MANEIRDQVQLSFRRSIEFCLSSIRHRFFRSMVTLAVIVLAIAFLMNILTEGMVTRSVAGGVEQEFGRLYRQDLFTGRITAETTTPASLGRELARLHAGLPRWKELERWSGQSPADFAALAQYASRAATYLCFFDNLDFGRKRKLVGREEDIAIFDRLSQPEQLAQLAQNLKSTEMLSLSLPSNADDLLNFVRGWPAYTASLAKLTQTIKTALDGAEQQLKQPLQDALTQAAYGQPAEREKNRQALLEALQHAGVEITADELKDICEARRVLLTMQRFVDYVKDPEFRNKWPNLHIAEDFSPERLLARYAEQREVREWVALIASGISSRKADPLPCDDAQILAFSERVRKAVGEIGRPLVAINDKDLGQSPKHKAFLQKLLPPVCREKWSELGLAEPFSAEAVLWNFAQNDQLLPWLKKCVGELPANKEEIKALADQYVLLVQHRGLKQLDFACVNPSPAEQKLIEYFQDPQFKMRWDELNARLDYSPAGILVCYTGEDYSLRVQNWVRDVSKKIAGRGTAPLPATEAEILEVARLEQERGHIRELSLQITRHGGSAEGLGERMFWLVVVSFVVCVVGIANAMLMAVTERFREIATMKCLGALDGFVMAIFLIESGLQGLIGATLGVVLGLFLALLRCGYSYGTYTLWYFPVGDVLLNMLVSMAAGMLLAMLAAVYPAWVASRMAPMEAMRVE